MLAWHLQHGGLALATSLSAALNAGLLFLGLRRRGVFQAQTGWGAFWLRLLLANGALAGVIAWLGHAPELWLQWTSFERIGQLALVVISGIAVYVVVLLACGIRPRHLVSPVKH